MSSPNGSRRRPSQLDRLAVEFKLGKTSGRVTVVQATRGQNGLDRFVLIRVPGLATVLEEMFDTNVNFVNGVYRFANQYSIDDKKDLKLLLRDVTRLIIGHIKGRSYKLTYSSINTNTRTSVMDFDQNMRSVSKTLF